MSFGAITCYNSKRKSSEDIRRSEVVNLPWQCGCIKTHLADEKPPLGVSVKAAPETVRSPWFDCSERISPLIESE